MRYLDPVSPARRAPRTGTQTAWASPCEAGSVNYHRPDIGRATTVTTGRPDLVGLADPMARSMAAPRRLALAAAA
jgi:hypothetical protein